MHSINLSFDVDGSRHDILIAFGDRRLQPGAGQHGLHLTATITHHDLPGGVLLLHGDSTIVGSSGHPRAWLATFTHANPLYLQQRRHQ